MVQMDVHGIAVTRWQTDVPRELEGPRVGDGALGACLRTAEAGILFAGPESDSPEP